MAIDHDDGLNSAGMAEDAAAELFQVAAMLLGNESEAVELVEVTVNSAEIDPCFDPVTARRQAMDHLLRLAVGRLKASDPAGFERTSAPGGQQSTCIESDDLSAAGLTPLQLEALLGGPGRSRLRQWLHDLPAAQRAVFVQRAVLGESNATVAGRLGTGAGTGQWTAEAAGNIFRQALCSLATALLHSAAMPAAV